MSFPYINMGEAYSQNGEADQAIEYFTKSLQIRLKVLGPEHPDVADTYHNLGVAYKQKGAYDNAIEYYKKELAIRRKVLGSNHPDIVTLQKAIESLRAVSKK